MAGRELTKAYITKYALTDGVCEERGEIDGDIFCVKRRWWEQRFRKNEFFLSKEEAIANAEERRIKKIASLKKQIAKLEKLKFEV